MGLLNELGFDKDEQRGMLVDPPDHVLAEASAIKPRPTVASNLMTAEPAARIAWWPAGGRLDPGTVSRFYWMVQMGRGEGWLIYDPDDEDSATAEEVRRAVAESSFEELGQVSLSTGEVALHVGPGS